MLTKNICRKCPANIPLLRLDGNTKKALALRLKLFLEQEEQGYDHWLRVVKPKLKKTLADQLERKHRQRIQAFKIVIWILTPTMERDNDFPGFWNRE
jgi:hypothetical protein